MKIIGRKDEIRQLETLRDSNRSEFVMVYGRRRVGKTFLIREFFNNSFDFYLTGIANGSRKEQLKNFHSKMLEIDPSTPWQLPSSWFEAFSQLKKRLENTSSHRKVIFLDELPWMDTQKSDFLKALESFWNTWASARTDILLIVCGSAASWMVTNIVRNHGGLHNRLTFKMKLNPFNLHECKEYLAYRGINWDNRHIAECYMIVGGIPYYLDMLSKELSMAQNIDRMFFSESALLEDEFHNLYASLFRNSSDYISIVEALSRKKSGFTREEILHATRLKDGGSVTRKLEELEQCGFIRQYKAIGDVRGMYQLADFYSIFYFHFLKKGKDFDSESWLHHINTPSYHTWCGLSFERLCMAHLPEIKQTLGISGISTSTFSFYSKSAQIDMVIERADNFVNLCEMKFTDQPFDITKAYAEKLMIKKAELLQHIKKRRTINLVMITSNGLHHNDYSINLVQNEIVLDDLFK